MATGSLFVVQEAVECLASGSMANGVLTIPVLLGLLLCPAVGFCIVRILADVADVVARFVATPQAISIPTVVFVRPAGHSCHPQVALVVAPSRGPPGLMR